MRLIKRAIKRAWRILLLVTLFVMADFSPAQGQALPDSAYVVGVIGHAQSYSISCESRSAADLAGFWGFSIGETEFLQALPDSDNPDEGFVGNPNDIWGRLPPNGYGVHAGPVAATLRDFGIQAEAKKGISWNDLRGEISAGRPVIVWVIGSMWPGTTVNYQALDGSTARVAAYEHTMLLTGYSANSIQVIDASSGQYEYYWLSSFLDSWGVLGNMAVFASGGDARQDEPADVSNGETYTVQPGDYLMELAREFGVAWLELAQYNSIGYPYTIYNGQVLQIPHEEAQEANTAAPEAKTPAKSSQTSHVANRWVRLPMVQRNSTAPFIQPGTNTLISKPSSETVIVLHTDSLVNFGRSIGVAWHVLAELNNLPPTHIVHPGEVLKVR